MRATKGVRADAMAGVFFKRAADKVSTGVERGLAAVTAPCKTIRENPINDTHVVTTTAGPELAWKVYSGKTKRGEPCSVWVLEKQALRNRIESSTQIGNSTVSNNQSAIIENILSLHRNGVQALAKLRHPSVLRMLEPLEETKNIMCFVSEPVVTSLANVCGNIATVGSYKDNGKQGDTACIMLSEVDVKHGMKQIAEGLSFLNARSSLVVRGLGPESCCIAETDGRWCICFLGWSLHVGNASDGLQMCTQLPLNYVAPECVDATFKQQQLQQQQLAASDVFSLGALTYALLKGKSPLGDPKTQAEYVNAVSRLASLNVNGLDPQATQCILRCLTSDVAMRSTIEGYLASGWFTEDRCLAALVFLENIVEKPEVQRVALVRELPQLLPKFDRRVLNNRVLPPLLTQLRNDQMTEEVLPLVIVIAKLQTKDEFKTTSLKLLLPKLDSSQGNEQAILLQNAGALSNVLDANITAGPLLNMILRGLGGDVTMQGLALKEIPEVSKNLDYTVIVRKLIPTICDIMMATSNASIRVHSMVCLSKLVHYSGVDDCVNVMRCVARVTAVDTNASTIMCCAGIGSEVAKVGGADVTARAVLPVMCPLLVARSLSSDQYKTVMKTFNSLLKVIDDQKVGPKKVSDDAGTIPSTKEWDSNVFPKSRNNSGADCNSADPFRLIPSITTNSISEPFKLASKGSIDSAKKEKDDYWRPNIAAAPAGLPLSSSNTKMSGTSKCDFEGDIFSGMSISHKKIDLPGKSPAQQGVTSTFQPVECGGVKSAGSQLADLLAGPTDDLFSSNRNPILESASSNRSVAMKGYDSASVNGFAGNSSLI